MIISRRSLMAGFALTGTPGLSWALPPAGGLSVEDARDVARIVDYLQGLSSAKGHFVQLDARGGESQGTFYIQRPGRARFDYAAPSGLVIASDGQRVSVVDHRLKTMQSYPLGMTPLALFLAKTVRLDRGVKVSEVVRGAGALTVVAEDGQRKIRGRIALDFADPPLTLTGWTLTDARAHQVRVRLTTFAPAPPQNIEFFRLTDPRETPDTGSPR
jgi:outer membrane lipoprotein-sorting protein